MEPVVAVLQGRAGAVVRPVVAVEINVTGFGSAGVIHRSIVVAVAIRLTRRIAAGRVALAAILEFTVVTSFVIRVSVEGASFLHRVS